MDILEDDVQIMAVARHRNGGTGRPFTAILFDFEGRRMLGIVFEGDTTDTAVVDVGMAAEGEVGYGVNSWRGDEFSPFLSQWARRARRDDHDGFTEEWRDSESMEDAARALWALGSHGGSD